jgi:molybdate transport system substrate-binding protein
MFNILWLIMHIRAFKGAYSSLEITLAWRVWIAACGLAVGLMVTMQSEAADNRIFAAGSLREVVTELTKLHRDRGGAAFIPVFGPSGKLRQEIEKGNIPEIFASAAIEHTEALFKAGKLRSNQILTRNQLCLMAAPGITLAPERLIEVILDPTLKLGTSTPKSDPAGDYTWELFGKIDKLRPSAYAKLDAKALKLLGGEFNPAATESAYPAIFKEKKADVFITYCTNAVDTAVRVPGLTWERFPDSINVAAVYGIGVSTNAAREADAFVEFALGPEGRKIFERHGFK